MLDPVPTPTDDLSEVFFGVEVKDPYRWLENETDERVKTWMSAHQSRARRYLDALPRREWLTHRLEELLYVEQRSAPEKRGSRYFFSVKPKDKEKQIHYVKEGKDGPAKVLLDANQLSADGSLSIGDVIPSFDGEWLLYFEHPNNADEATLRTLNVSTREHSRVDTIPDLRYTYPSWARDNSGFYYLWLPNDESIPSQELVGHGEIRFHRLGEDPKGDETIFPATHDPSQFLHASVSHDGELLLVYKSHGWSRNEVFISDLKARTGFQQFAGGSEAIYSVATFNDQLFILTNEDAPRFRLFKTTRNRLAREHWQEIVREHESAVLQEASIVGGRLVLRYLKDAYTELQLRDLSGASPRLVKLPAIGTASSLLGTEDDAEAYFAFSSFTYPSEIYEVDLNAFEQPDQGTTLHYRAKVPVEPDRFEVHQEWFASKDGTRIPMFVVHKKGLALNGQNPTLLTGYGGFNQSMVPRFVTTIYPWLELGGVYALPNLRGGGEYGKAWHEAGKGKNKQNVFDDFIAAAEHLVARGYTTPSRLGISGRSNGGLLVGAALTQRPELFGAVLCGVPLLDMIRFPEVGLGTAWVPEYGDPDNESDFRVLYEYSPYHRLERGARYPALLMLSADADDRVDPMHARKFVARLEAVTDGSSKTLLRIEENAGHTGADMRQRLIARTTDEFAFLLAELANDVNATPALDQN